MGIVCIKENNCAYQGTTNIHVLEVEAPETLRVPVREEFTDVKSYACALKKFERYGRWDTDEE